MDNINPLNLIFDKTYMITYNNNEYYLYHNQDFINRERAGASTFVKNFSLKLCLVLDKIIRKPKGGPKVAVEFKLDTD